MGPHPDFAESALPRSADLSSFLLTPLSPEQTEEDFEVVMSSAAVLNVFGDWPAGLTLEANRIDLAWHEREFTARRSFAWIVRSMDGAYLGCVYLYPEMGARGAAEVVSWIRDMPGREGVSDDLVAELEPFFAEYVPDDVALHWRR